MTSQIDGSARVRRTVSVVFADVTASTALAERLDPESFHDVLDQYCATCTSAVERHGGRVAKFIGDAVVGVFGLPTVHEDDALRAVRAALEIRSAVAALSETLMRERGIELGCRRRREHGRGVRGPRSSSAGAVSGG